MLPSSPSPLLLDHPLRDDVRHAVDELTRRHGATVAAILFHGSCLRDEAGTSPLDLYVLVDDYAAFHHRPAAAFANAVLPPSVSFLPGADAASAGAKVAVISRRHFAARLTPGSLDTTLWARFCQPAVLAYCRDAEVAAWVATALSTAMATAVYWAIRLGPEEGDAETFWTTLFRHTYGAELRVEGTGRAARIYESASALFDAAFAHFAPAEGGSPLAGGRYRVHLGQDERQQARARWRRRRMAGKALNVARLTKALFTFDGGVDYIVGKLERHSGQKVELSRWQRRHPLLAAPGVLLSLRRRGVIR